MTANVAWFSLHRSDVQRKATDATSQMEYQLWDVLVNWCEARSLFLGGSIDGAVVYAALASLTPQQYRALRAWLMAWLNAWSKDGQETWDLRMQMTEVSSLPLLGGHLAGIEAVSQAQEFLVQRLAEGALSLAGIAIPLQQRWRSALSPLGDSLELRLARLELLLFISRNDQGPSAVLGRFNGQSLGRGDLEALIPELLSLHWRELKSAGDLSVGEWTAEYRDWRLNLCADPGSRLDHREVMRRWLVWLCTG
ncbi:hypothetical protein [Polaromonas sp.]|uniref:hypothetical protein n=1 Tax=Polaromonas sp. TaxID=1869339 RepID=UPI0032675A18